MSGAASTRRILIVEDHPILAAGVQALLEDNGGYDIVGIAGTVADGVRLALRERPDLAIVDYRLPDGTAVEFIGALGPPPARTAVVVLTAESGDAPLLASVTAGAVGYVLKSEASSHLIEAIDRVLAGESALPAPLLAHALRSDRRQRDEAARLETVRSSLTPRELEILKLLVRGRDNRTISAELTIGYSTVRTHVQNIIEKLGARSRLEAVAKALDLGIVDRHE